MAVFGITKLKATVGTLGGFAKGNRYNVIITPPAGIPALKTDSTLGNLQYLCESVSLPTKGIASSAQDIYGPPREIPYGETFTEAALSFILDDAFTLKRYFDTWQTNIINPESGNVANYWNDITGSIKISRLPNDSQILTRTDGYNVELREAYPSAVGEIALGHTQGNEILRLSVTFKYRKWMSLNETTSDIWNDI